MKIVDLAIKKSVAGLGTLALETRRWLKSAQRHEIDVRPMARLQNPESQIKYARYMRRFVCYCLRVAAANREVESRRQGAESEGDSEDDSEGYREENESDGDGEDNGVYHERDKDESNEEEDLLKDARELYV